MTVNARENFVTLVSLKKSLKKSENNKKTLDTDKMVCSK